MTDKIDAAVKAITDRNLERELAIYGAKESDYSGMARDERIELLRRLKERSAAFSYRQYYASRDYFHDR